jgi:hypothetical protein
LRADTGLSVNSSVTNLPPGILPTTSTVLITVMARSRVKALPGSQR